MARTLRRVLAIGLGLAVAAVLGGCLFVRAPQAVGPALIVSDLIGPVGGEGEFTLEVVDLPGAAGLSVLGLRYDPTKFRATQVEGLNGFVLLCSRIDNDAGELRCMLIHPLEGLTRGAVARVRGQRLAPGDPGFALDTGAVELVDNANQLVPRGSYTLRLGGAPLYYIRR